MTRINARAKGASGEREACEWLERNLFMNTRSCGERKLSRNIAQSRDGGHDIDANPFMFEVKRRQSIAFDKWWIQISKAVKGKQRIPVVMFRPNKSQWDFLISAKWIGNRSGWIHIPAQTFINWAIYRMERGPFATDSGYYES